ncbi:MAG: SDR family NAD(P)-dependent oxidoreductase [Lentisphaeria bacterium]|nr:SDR family NAD(P)-dependent oxidoreductase [Lentisphaeria bacterium]
MKLNGKKVLITGGARRIGGEISRSLAAQGAILYIHCHKGQEEGRELLSRLPGSGHTLLTADLSFPGAAEKMMQECGEVDILVNNASIYARTPIALEESEARRYFEVNFWSPLALMRCFAAPERKSPGVVINIVDQEILRPAVENGIYALSRKALADATAAFALEHAHRGLRFNAIAPGPMIPPPGLEHSTMSKVLKSVPAGKRIEPDDLVKTLSYIIDNDSLTGAVIPLDGGQHLKNYEYL